MLGFLWELHQSDRQNTAQRRIGRLEQQLKALEQRLSAVEAILQSRDQKPTT